MCRPLGRRRPDLIGISTPLSLHDTGPSPLFEFEHTGWRTVFRSRNVPLPEPHLVGLVAGVVLSALVPWALVPKAWIGHAFGWPLILGGLSLMAWAVAAAKNIDVGNPDQLVVSGPYALTRNPMYLAWGAIYLGVTFVINTSWLLALFPAVLCVTHIVVLREERHLEGRFGASYRRYKSAVRRYL